MLIKLPINRLKDRQAEMTSIADRMTVLNDSRILRLIEINADASRTPRWKSDAAEKMKRSPEIEALAAQMRLHVDVIKDQKRLWRDSATLLRDAAVPRRGETGVDAYTTALAELNFLMNEATALSQNSGALQAALDRAVMAEDWRSVYALTVGRIDQFGRALGSATGLDGGTPLDCLPLPGRDEAEEIFYQCEIQQIRAAGVVFNMSSGETDPTSDNSGTKLAAQTPLLAAKRNHEDAIKQRDRLRGTLSSLERFELYKNGVPAPQNFDAALSEAVAKIHYDAGLEATLD